MSRFHPYGSQNQNSKAPIKGFEGKKLITMESISKSKQINITSEYELQSYLSIGTKSNNNNNNNNSYPVNVQKGILKNKTNIQERPVTKQTDTKKRADENMVLKKEEVLVFSVTCKSVKQLAQLAKEPKKKPLPSSYLVVIFGVLDSIITRENSKCEFSLQDSYGRIRCIFTEMDRRMANISRGKIIRVVGKYDEKNSELKCFSVRIATEKEISNTGRNVTQTNSYIKKNFV